MRLMLSLRLSNLFISNFSSLADIRQMTVLSWLTLLALQDFDKTEMSLRPQRGL
jgi:hypothetical protein